MIIIEMKADAQTAELLKLALAHVANSIEKVLEEDVDDMSTEEREKLFDVLERVNFIGNDLHCTLTEARLKEQDMQHQEKLAAFLQDSDTLN